MRGESDGILLMWMLQTTAEWVARRRPKRQLRRRPEERPAWTTKPSASWKGLLPEKSP